MMADKSDWPAHLRDDAPYRTCNVCLRKTWAPSDEEGSRCKVLQPDGEPCLGTFGPFVHPAAPREGTND